MPIPKQAASFPDSAGHNTILVAIDWFSKAHLKGLPMTMEMATILFNQVFHIYGLLEDIISERGS